MWKPAGLVLLLLSAALPLAAAQYLITTPAELDRISQRLTPGDSVILQNGTWTNAVLKLRGSGTRQKPITLRPANPGRTVLTGASTVEIEGEHLLISDLLLKDVRGAGDTIRISGQNCHISGCAVIGGTSKFFLHVAGTKHEIDHCYFAGKTSEGPTVQIEVGSQPNDNLIRSNHFGPRPPLRRNGGETIRIGYSHQSMSNSATIVEHNLFDRCDGEIEIISSKSCGNIYRKNTFLNCAGMLTLRHGNACRVEDNFFLGHHKRGSGGIRVIGEDHFILNNYIEGVDQGGIWVTAGIPNSPLVGYFQARNAVIAYNSIVDSRGPAIDLSAGLGSSGRTLLPENITITNNWFAPAKQGTVLKGEVGPGLQWQGNHASYQPDAREENFPPGIVVIDARRTGSGETGWRPDPGPSRAGSSLRLTGPTGPLSAADVGPAWLPVSAR